MRSASGADVREWSAGQWELTLIASSSAKVGCAEMRAERAIG